MALILKDLQDGANSQFFLVTRMNCKKRSLLLLLLRSHLSAHREKLWAGLNFDVGFFLHQLRCGRIRAPMWVSFPLNLQDILTVAHMEVFMTWTHVVGAVFGPCRSRRPEATQEDAGPISDR